MKERPIIFKAEEVRAILDGRKTQTRRIVKAVPSSHEFHGWVMSSTSPKDEGKACWAIGKTPLLNNPIRVRCPFGQPGDALYVRESFSHLESFDFFNPAVPSVVPDFWYWADGEPGWGNWTRPQSGAVMPRAASRITLEITGVRVERLQDISDLDAIAEGCTSADMRSGDSMQDVYARFWSSIYGVESWQGNPWVWVVEFKREEGE